MSRSPTLLDWAMEPDVLNAAWRRLRTEHTPWAPHISRDELQRDLVKHLLYCREQVLSGRYRPQPLRQFAMRKPDGRQRVLSAQYLQDKLIQRALLTVLEPRAEALFHEDSFAYRPKRNVAMALDKVRQRVRIGQDWLVDADIEKFFDSIPHRSLIAILKSFVNDSSAMHLIEKWLKQGSHHSSLLSTRRGIAQGAILSPLYCNLYLHRFDSALAQANIPFVRFADDFLLFADSKANAEESRVFAEKELARLQLKIHPQKTQVVRSSPTVTFLGAALPHPSR